MLEKLAKQTAIYGISTIVVRFLNYLLTPYFTRVFDPGVYGITVDVYALIPFALVILTMGMESGYFRFAAKADEAGGDVTAAKRRLFATTWGITSLAALLFFGLVTLFRTTVSEWMGADYAANPDFVVWVAAIIFLDVCTAIPFARLREQGRALTYVGFKALSVVITVVLAVAFGLAGFYETSFGVGWVFVGNLIASEDRGHVYEIFKRVFLINFLISGVSSIVLLNTLNPFIVWWLGPEYMLSGACSFVIILNFFVVGMRRSAMVFKTKAGIFHCR